LSAALKLISVRLDPATLRKLETMRTELPEINPRRPHQAVRPPMTRSTLIRRILEEATREIVDQNATTLRSSDPCRIFPAFRHLTSDTPATA